MSKLPDDLARFLFLVPHVAQHTDGVPVDELCEMMSCSSAALHRLIERVAMVGTPAGSPDELVEIFLESDRVFVALPQRFTRPPRFSVEEMLALLVALAPLREGELPELRARAERLSQNLLELASERAGTVAPALLQRVVISADGAETPAHLRDLEVAVREHRIVDAEYYTAGRDALTQRLLEPVGLLQVRGAWYVVGSEAKTYKVERFRSIALLDARFVPPVLDERGVDLAAIRRGLESRKLGTAKRMIAIRVRGRTRRFSADAPQGLRRWVRCARGNLVVESPAEERDAIVNEARELLARYQDV